MIDTIYLEQAIADHPRAQQILSRYPRANKIVCKRYGEVFNRRNQNFRLQKKQPALILAQKSDNFVLPAPEGFGIGGQRNFYFSHMLNCIYDCRYCFLQGMYRSAHYVIFVNFEGFSQAIQTCIHQGGNEQTTIFSGYDCDSLALDGITGFIDYFLPIFAQQTHACLELRTKSIATSSLLNYDPSPQIIVAFSLTPSSIAQAIEHGAPKVEQRIRAAQKLARKGWKIGLRFDPLIYHPNYRQLYTELFTQALQTISHEEIHSVSLGPLRFPKAMFERIVDLYPDEKLFAGPLYRRGSMVSYPQELEAEMHHYCSDYLRRYLSDKILFTCLAQ